MSAFACNLMFGEISCLNLSASLFVCQALGNHEFDNGVEGLMKPFMEEIRCPVLSANIKTDEALAPTFGSSYLPYKILAVGGERVGVVGYTSQETQALSRPGERTGWVSVYYRESHIVSMLIWRPPHCKHDDKHPPSISVLTLFSLQLSRPSGKKKKSFLDKNFFFPCVKPNKFVNFL